MKIDTVIKGGTIVTAEDTYQADIGIADGRIVAIGLDRRGSDDRCVGKVRRICLPLTLG